MSSSRLVDRECVPCSGAIPALGPDEIASLLTQLGGRWRIDGGRLTNEYVLRDFATALELVNRIGAVAEAQNHHPDITLAWGKVGVTIWTHAIDGLSENDFVLAAKCDGERARLGDETPEDR